MYWTLTCHVPALAGQQPPLNLCLQGWEAAFTHPAPPHSWGQQAQKEEGTMLPLSLGAGKTLKTGQLCLVEPFGPCQALKDRFALLKSSGTSATSPRQSRITSILNRFYLVYFSCLLLSKHHIFIHLWRLSYKQLHHVWGLLSPEMSNCTLQALAYPRSLLPPLWQSALKPSFKIKFPCLGFTASFRAFISFSAFTVRPRSRLRMACCWRAKVQFH